VDEEQVEVTDYTDEQVETYGKLFREHFADLWQEALTSPVERSSVWLTGAAVLKCLETALNHYVGIEDEDHGDATA